MNKYIILGVIVAVVVLVISMGYVKAPTDVAYIISGIKKKPRVLLGRAGIRIPFLERKDTLLVRQISIDIKTNEAIPTQDFIGVNVDAVAKVHVISEQDVNVDSNGNYLDGVVVDENTHKITKAMAESAMKNFVNMNEKQIIEALTDSLQGNMREIIGTQTLKSLCNDRKGFGDQVQEKAQKDMNALGIEIMSCNIQSIRDEKDLINALGQDNMSKIQKDASIAKAQADAEVAIAQAEAQKKANDAKVASETEIARKQTELAITKANLQVESDTKRAEADAAYKIQEQTQRRTIEITASEADIAKQNKAIELKEKEALVKERELDANIKKQADAEKYAKQQQSDAELYARQKQAEAELFEVQRQAEARKAQAEAEAYAKKQNAEAVKVQGEAEAEAIRAKGIAEAEAIDKKAEAMKKYGNAAIAEMAFKVLPDMAEAIAKPVASIDKLSIIDGGTGNGANSMYSMVTGGMEKVIESVRETTGIDLKEVINANTYDAKVNRNVNITSPEIAKEVSESVSKTVKDTLEKSSETEQD